MSIIDTVRGDLCTDPFSRKIEIPAFGYITQRIFRDLRPRFVAGIKKSVDIVTYSQAVFVPLSGSVGEQ